MKIYVVMSGEWEGRGVEKMFLSERKAQEYCRWRNLLEPDEEDWCTIVTKEAADDEPLIGTNCILVESYGSESRVDFLNYVKEPQGIQIDAGNYVSFTIDVSACKNYSEVLELAEETLEKLKESGVF